MNTEATGYTTTSYTDYMADYIGITKIIDDLEEEDTDFYRLTRFRGYRSKNDATWNNYHSSSTFSSTAYAGLSNFYGKIGLEHSTNAYAINGATPVIYSLFNVKYLVTNKHIANNDLFTYYSGYAGEFLYKNNYTLPVAFMVPEDQDEQMNYDIETNPFAVQNNFIKNATGIEKVIESFYVSTGSSELDKFDYTYQDKKLTITVKENCFLYVTVNKNIDSMTAKIGENTVYYSGVDHGRTVDLGYLEEGTVVELYNSENKDELNARIGLLNEDNYKEAITELSKQGLNVTNYNDTTLNGTITVLEDGLMFTSIPYDTSWTVYVDGEKTEYEEIGGAFIAVPLTKGTHEISFKFTANGYKAGLVLTIISILIIGLMIFYRVKFKKEITEEGALTLLLPKKNKTIESEE